MSNAQLGSLLARHASFLCRFLPCLRNGPSSGSRPLLGAAIDAGPGVTLDFAAACDPHSRQLHQHLVNHHTQQRAVAPQRVPHDDALAALTVDIFNLIERPESRSRSEFLSEGASLHEDAMLVLGAGDTSGTPAPRLPPTELPIIAPPQRWMPGPCSEVAATAILREMDRRLNRLPPAECPFVLGSSAARVMARSIGKPMSRKQIEVSRVAALTRALRHAVGAVEVFDIGAGKGHLGEALSALYRVPCRSIDRSLEKHGFASRVYRAAEGHSRKGDVPRPRPTKEECERGVAVFSAASGKAFESGHQHTAAAVSEASIPLIARGVRKKPSVVIGLHTCGPLADLSAEIVARAGADAFLNVPCCFHQLRHDEGSYGGCHASALSSRCCRGCDEPDGEFHDSELLDPDHAPHGSDAGAPTAQWWYRPQSAAATGAGLGGVIGVDALFLANLGHHRTLEDVQKWMRVRAKEEALKALYCRTPLVFRLSKAAAMQRSGFPLARVALRELLGGKTCSREAADKLVSLLSFTAYVRKWEAASQSRVGLADEELQRWWDSAECWADVVDRLLCKAFVGKVGRSIEIALLLDRAFALAERGYFVAPRAILPVTASARHCGIVAIRAGAVGQQLDRC